MQRSKQIIKLSIEGIIINIFLVIFKILIGLLSNSIAIILDAVNNFSDAISSIVTIIGTKLSNRAASRKHPFGFGRIEYITSTIISFIILYTGFASLEESIGKIINPSEPTYSIYTFLILVIAIFVKLLFGLYLKKKGRQLNAQSLRASGSDSVMDSLVSLATLVSALVFIFSKINIDGFLGVIISILILKTGYDILSESLGSLIGVRTESKLTTEIYDEIKEYPEVEGAYDLILHDYGPSEMIGSIHIEINDKMTAKEIDKLSRDITTKIYSKYGIILTIGIYAANTSNPEFLKIKDEIRKIVLSYPNILQIHGFYLNEKSKEISFDVVINFQEKNLDNMIENLNNELTEKFPGYHFQINPETDFSFSED